MSEQLTDEEQVEALKKWWKENGTAIIVGIVIGISAIVGFWKWNEYTESRALEASAMYDDFVTGISGEKDEHISLYETLKKDYEGTSYAALAALRMAAFDYDKGNKQKAIEHLQWAVEHPGHDSIMHIARIRLSKLLVAEGKIDQAETYVKEISEPAFDAQYTVIRGDIHAARGNIEKARVAYQSALDLGAFSGKQRDYIQMKLDNMGAGQTASTLEAN